ncbi:hypothetical protein G6O69_04245 [Pseudenhygromyxa sp. WMMC2535]|uniref:hypothetical protein n=1 Tax=Pseudenhygromyxa sp. WMMC2535 TaxID=2712867 RepID=UPI001554DCFF|nr:hypothetical protein [Pseudenhygromyxa sp. WMMC2535]NVB37028.1 hypothetical protein [Pseudenhygromyxa sp. WMMC2535]
MSRPPRPYPEQALQDELLVRNDRLRLVPQGFAEFVALEAELAEAELDLRPPGGDDEFTQTLFELSAALGHVLARHQDHYGSEAFFSTAATTTSLLRHGRRLAYTPDPGLSATGVVSLTVKDGLAGEIAAGLALRSAARGERKSQIFETLSARKVEAAWNQILPRDASEAIDYSAGVEAIELRGLGLDLELGELLLIRDPESSAAGYARRIVELVEDEDAETTRVGLDEEIADTDMSSSWQVLARPKLSRRLFGWDADPRRFPAQALHETSVSDALGCAPSWAWTSVDYADGGEASDLDVFLARTVEDSLDDAPLMIALDDQLHAARVEAGSQRDVSLRFACTQGESFPNPPNDPIEYEAEYAIAASTTRVRLIDESGSTLARSASALDPRARLLGEFELELELAESRASEVTVGTGEALILDASYALEPGMLVVFEDLVGEAAALLEIDRVDELVAGGESYTTITCSGVSAEAISFALGDLRILANVAEVSHGKAREEFLTDSDGITPHHRATLSKSPVSQLAGIDGAEPALVVKVSEVEWTRVVDFGESGPNDRHYRVALDAEQQLSVVFGDGRRGAIPAKGRRQLVASYRVGLGEQGNLAAGELAALAQAHPLVAAVRNPLAITGGSEPANDAALRREGTRYIRTFDRAVSARDHADLALLYPGVARANASWDSSQGVILVAAGEQGDALADARDLVAFLDARRDTSVALVMRAPEALALRLHLSLEIDAAYELQNVEDSVRAALLGEGDEDSGVAAGLFTFAAREFGEGAHLSQVYAALSGLPGLEYVEVTHFAYVEPEPAVVRDVLLADTHQWLRLSPADLVLSSASVEVP